MYETVKTRERGASNEDPCAKQTSQAPCWGGNDAPIERERGASNEEPRAEGACESERARLCGALRGFERRMDARVAVKVSPHQGPNISSSEAPHSLSRTSSQAPFPLVASFEVLSLPLSHHLKHPISSSKALSHFRMAGRSIAQRRRSLPPSSSCTARQRARECE